jgi:hypothetical protein
MKGETVESRHSHQDSEAGEEPGKGEQLAFAGQRSYRQKGQ